MESDPSRPNHLAYGPTWDTWSTYLTYPPDLPIITLRIRTYNFEDPKFGFKHIPFRIRCFTRPAGRTGTDLDKSVQETNWPDIPIWHTPQISRPNLTCNTWNTMFRHFVSVMDGLIGVGAHQKIHNALTAMEKQNRIVKLLPRVWRRKAAVHIYYALSFCPFGEVYTFAEMVCGSFHT